MINMTAMKGQKQGDMSLLLINILVEEVGICLCIEYVVYMKCPASSLSASIPPKQTPPVFAKILSISYNAPFRLIWCIKLYML